MLDTRSIIVINLQQGTHAYFLRIEVDCEELYVLALYECLEKKQVLRFKNAICIYYLQSRLYYRKPVVNRVTVIE